MSEKPARREHSEWRLVYDGYDPAEERLREALCTLGNGVFATRGAAPECSAGPHHYPGTYLAGVYDRLKAEKVGRVIENESIVNAPNWLPLTFRCDDGPDFSIDEVEILDYEQVLELRTGVLVRTARFRDAAGRETSLGQRRLVHMGKPHLAALETTVRPENWSGKLTFISALDGTIENTNVERYRELPGKHVEVLARSIDGGDVAVLRARTVQSRVEIVEAMRTDVFVDGVPADVRRAPLDGDPGTIGFEVVVDAIRGDEVRVEKIVSIHTSRDMAVSEPGLEAIAEVRRSGGFADLENTHAEVWDGLWERCEIGLEGNIHADMVLNLHTLHLLQTVSHNSVGLDVGLPARGLHGEAYRGHVFWDELFVFRYLNYRLPEVARSLLMYRYRRLDAARRRAREAGWEGAMFPWQSGSDGREETQVVHLNPKSGRWIPDNSRRQYHVGIAIAYDVWQHFAVTGDMQFLAEYGMEMFLEIARFWESVATYDALDNTYDIVGVMGPDEFHDSDPNWDGEGLRNNTYTNVMVAWMFTHAASLLGELPDVQKRRVMARTGVDAARLGRWQEMSYRLRVPLLDNGVPSQFEGYGDLAEFDWEGYRKRYGDIERLDRILEAEGDSVDNYKASKQADVLMLLYLLSYEELCELFGRLGVDFDEDLLTRTMEYYLARTSHGSTLSRIVHSWVLARSDRRAAMDLLMSAMDADIAECEGSSTPEGIHLGAMVGSIDMAERGFSGMDVRGDRLYFKPSLPPEISCLSFRAYHRSRWLKITLADDEVTVESETTERPPLEVECRGVVRSLGSGERIVFTRPAGE